MRASPESIFLGNTPATHRRWLASFFAVAKAKYDTLIIPCCGQFAAAQVAIRAGWKPENIGTSDVSLFTSLLGLFCTGTPLSKLEIKLTLPGLAEEPTSYAEAFYAIKLAQELTHSRSFYDERRCRDLLLRKTEHIAKLEIGLTETRKLLSGITYEIRDMFEHIEAELDNANAILYVNPPGYFHGYEKMYNFGGKITWNEPKFRDFDPKTCHIWLRDTAASAKALIIRYKYKELIAEEKAEAVFAAYKGKERSDYLLSNHPDEVKALVKPSVLVPKVELSHYRYAVLPTSYDLDKALTVAFVPCDRRKADYYRDLFVHKLGTVTATWNFLLTLDSQIAGVVGFGVNIDPDAFTFDSLEEVYGICITHEKYNINKLLMMLITCGQFRQELAKVGRHGGNTLRTTCLSPYPELKINRGILKLTSRVKQGANYKLRYEADFRNDTYEEVLRAWLKKEKARTES